MDRLAQSPLRRAVGAKKLKGQGNKYRVPNDEDDKTKTTRKRRLAPIATRLPTEKARKEFELALQRRDFEHVLWLIENGDVPATYETFGGETALLAAIGARHIDAFRLLMQRGVSIDARNRHGFTPLMKAIAAAAPFAEASANDHAPNNPEVDDSEFDNTMVACVLAQAPDLHVRDASGHTAFDWAVRTRNAGAQALLTDHQQRLRDGHADFADCDSRRRECLALVARHDALAMDMERLLLLPLLTEGPLERLVRQSVADAPRDDWLNALQDIKVLSANDGPFLDVYVLERETRDGWTPLIKAGACGFTDTLQLLFSFGVDVNHESARLKHTALTWASYCGHEDTVVALLRVPTLDINRSTREGKTALIHAVANRQLGIVRQLVQAMHAQSVVRVGGKDAFHHNEKAVLARRPSRWGKRPVSTPSGKRRPGTDEWHDLVLAMLETKDDSDRDAMAYVGEETDEVTSAIRKELEHALQQARDHAAYVATHKERTMPTACKYASDGCDFVAPLDLLPSHELHECRKRRIECERCGLDIPFETQEVHDRVACVQRLVSCVNRERGCELRIAVADAEAHARNHCRYRLVRCRLDCGNDDGLIFAERVAHETTECVRRLVPCPQNCGAAPFPANESNRHAKHECVKRLIKCTGGSERTGGCGTLVAVDAMAFHVTTLCPARRVACKWATHGCTVALGGAVESRQHHEDAECPFRLVTCQYEGCHASGTLMACFLDEHYAWQCSLAPVACPYDCGVALMARHLMDAHTQTDAGDCTLRPMRCRLDLCGKMLRLYDSEPTVSVSTLTSDCAAQPDARASLRGLRQRLERATAFLEKLRKCHETAHDKDDEEATPTETEPVFWGVSTARQVLLAWLEPLHAQLESDLRDLEQWKQEASARVRVLSFDGATQRHLVEFQRDGHADWLDLSGREYGVEGPTVSDTPSSFRCGFITASDAATHEASECPLRLVPCPLACGQRLTAQAVAPHLAKRCNLRHATCRLGCGAVLPFVTLSDHELSDCERRQVSCDHCHVTLPHRALATHVATQCAHVPRRCRLGCGAMLPSIHFTVHEGADCPKRLVPCPQCDHRVFISELASHTTTECVLRVYGPCDSGCGVTLRVNERTHHLLYDCAMRQLPCPLCHDVVAWRDLAQHKTLLCRLRDVVCRRGCGQIVRDVDAAAHEETDCVRRLVYCPNRCGAHLVASAQHEHLALHCSMRVVPCPLDCGDQLFAYQCEPHALRCRQRLVLCGAGAANCARPLRLWIHSRRFVTCKSHGETGLLWAIKTQDEDLVSYFVQATNDDQLDVEFANGFSPLTMATALKSLEIAKTLLRHGADVNGETSRGRTPLGEAVLARDPAMVELLLEHRASVGHVNRHGQSVVALAEMLASDANDPNAARIVELLKAQQAMDADLTTLFRAIACSDYAFVASLLQFSSGVSGTNTATLRELEQQRDDAQKAFDAVALDVDESVALLNESIADTEAKMTQAQRLRERVDDCHAQIATVAECHDASLAASSALEAELLTQIQSITALDIAALLNAATPPAEYLVVMKSICMFCGVMPRGRRHASEYTDLEWWKTAQALLMDRSLLSKLRAYRSQIVTPDVMAKVRRECLRTDAFAATTRSLHETKTTETMHGEETVVAPVAPVAAPSSPHRHGRRGALVNGLDIISRLAVWVQGVEREYKHQHARATLVDKQRRLAVSLDAHTQGLATASFDMQVATRSLPARQHEVEVAQAKRAAAERSLTAAAQRVKAYKLVHRAASNGHTALSFACAVGNDAMVHLLLTHGASAGPVAEDLEACAALIQLSFRDVLYRRKRQKNEHQSRSDAAIEALVRTVAQTFLLGHYRRRRRLTLWTHRVPLHEAVYNGHASIVKLLLQHSDAKLWHKTHVFPLRVMPGATDRVKGDAASMRALHKRGGWTLVPLTGARQEEETDENELDPLVLETRLAPLTIDETLCLAVHACDSRTFLRDAGGWRHDETRYSETNTCIHDRLTALKEIQAAQTREILARKNVAKKTKARDRLHAQLDVAIVAKAFPTIATLLGDGAFADYETKATGLTALSAACADETLFVTNRDGHRVRAVTFLLDRASNRPFVDFESSSGKTALGVAATYGATLCAQELLDRGANVNYATRTRGDTALMAAARCDQVAFVAFLLRHAATNVFLKDVDGKTAFDHAMGHECQHLVASAMSGGRRPRGFAIAGAAYTVCQWGCGFMAAAYDHTSETDGVVDMTHPLRTHEQQECPKRIVRCPLGCAEPTLWAERVERHTHHECPKRLIPCPQPKCGLSVPAETLAAHARDTCDWRVVLCACGEQLAYTKYVVHAATTCPQRLVPCPNHCVDGATGDSALLRACDLKQHERTDCVHRVVRCRNGCTIHALLARDRERHETQQCALRRVPCKWNCGEPTVLAHAQQHHEAEACLLRELVCPLKCGLAIRAVDLDVHTTETCAHRNVVCSLGCGRKVPLHTIDRHVANECHRRIVACPQRCGRSMADGDVAAHVAAQCPQRLTTCALCGASGILQTQMAEHREATCRMRVVRCRFQCYAPQPLRACGQQQHEQFECALRPIVCPLGCGETLVAHASKRHEKVCDMRIVTCTRGCGAEMREKDRQEHEQRYCASQKMATLPRAKR